MKIKHHLMRKGRVNLKKIQIKEKPTGFFS
jgi:hypothetical protein